ncbi:Na(+)-translocating NADH-quinone reductase subunit F [Flavobacteriaceae bacterium]|jgi:hypothetical protein|nr:Na(+)-translocating NADH-quinone reductase subunit F [Flavobacteriaceae bacterium]
METLTSQEIHQLAMQEVGTYLEHEGFEFLAVNSQIKRSPQFVCVKDKILYFVVTQGCLYPQPPKEYDSIKMNKVKLHADKNKAKVYFAGVGFANAHDYKKPLSKTDPYVVNFDGIQKII